jgi:hypothetical protein
MISPERTSLSVTSLKEILNHEPELVRRIQAMPNGGQLLIADPIRLLGEVGLRWNPDVLEELKSKHPAFFKPTGREHTYDTVKQSHPGDDIRVTVKGLFKKSHA